MNNIIKRKWNQNSMVIIEDLQGMAFQAESGGHTFQISGIDGEGNAVALSGTPAGVLLRADGQDVTLTCSVSGGIVSATLPANAYVVPGRFGLTIFLTRDGQKTAIYAAVGTVGKTSSGTVAPPAGSDVVTLVNAIAAAVATIPASYTDLMAGMAPTYSTSGLYAVGSYAWYSGKLYRCTTAITSGETWNSGHWTLANLGSDLVDLKSALNETTGCSVIDYTVGSFFSKGNSVTITGGVPVPDSSSGSYKCAYVECEKGDRFTISSNLTGNNGLEAWRFVNTNGEVLTTSIGNLIAKNVLIEAPENAKWLILNDRITETGFSYIGELDIDQIKILKNSLIIDRPDNNTLLLDMKPHSVTYEIGHYNTETGLPSESTTAIRTGYIPVKDKIAIINNGDFTSSTDLVFTILLYDENKNIIPDSEITINALDGRQYVINENREMYYITISIEFATSKTMTQTYIDWISERVKYYNSFKDASISYAGATQKINSAVSPFGYAHKRNSHVKSNSYDSNSAMDLSFITSRAKINISRNGKTYGTDFDIRTKRLSGGITYYIAPDGDDTNDGLTNETPLHSFETALSKSNIKTLIVESGDYFLGTHFQASIEFSGVNVICENEARIIFGNVINVSESNYFSDTYFLSGSGIRLVIDANTLKALTVVQSDPTDFYQCRVGNAGATVKYPNIPGIHDLYTTKNSHGWIIKGSVYFEGLTFIGGSYGLETLVTDNDEIAFSYCKFLYSRRNGLTAVGGTYFLYRCEASYNYLDGFNYHHTDGNTSTANVAEIECEGYWNGYLNTDDESISNNGSTMHDYGRIMRLNCRYGNCKGGVMADKHSRSYNFGCEAFASNCDVTGWETNNCCIESIETNVMYLYDCFTYGSNYDLTCAEGNNEVYATVDYALKSVGESDNVTVIT